MKKILVVCLIAVMAVSACLCASAAPNGFVNSVSGNPAPEIIEAENDNENCTAVLVITPYSERKNLTDTLRTLLEDAYSDIVNADKVTDLADKLQKIAEDNDLTPEDLVVSDLFDIHYTDCEKHEGHYDFNIVIKAETLKNFVALIHMDHDGNWEVIENARLTNGGTTLSFSIDDFSPFAIVVDPTASGNPPPTNDNGRIYLYASLMLISAVAFFVVVFKSKKQSA